MPNATSRWIQAVGVLAGLSLLTMAEIGAAGADTRGKMLRPATDKAIACPPRPPEIGANRNPGARSLLVPPGAEYVLLCSYPGLGKPRTLESHISFDRSVVERLTKRFDQLQPVPTGIYHCPKESGAQIDAVFGYPREPDDSVVVHLSGCRWVSNGAIAQQFYRSPALLRQLRRTTHWPSATGNERLSDAGSDLWFS
jgi:hypothetical protein